MDIGRRSAACSFSREPFLSQPLAGDGRELPENVFRDSALRPEERPKIVILMEAVSMEGKCCTQAAAIGLGVTRPLVRSFLRTVRICHPSVLL